MALPKNIQDIIDQMLALTDIDVLSVADPESSMLKEPIRNKILEIYRKFVIPHYEKEFKRLGGADGVLKDLENYIVMQINLNNGMGENARNNIHSRTQFKGELGVYHTALRALLDKEPTLNWPSLLHKGSTEEYYTIRLREILAYYWLVASDPQMKIAEVFERDAKTNEDKLKLLQASKENFVGVLAEIRRAHNEGLTKDIPIDDPSCGPGTGGRILIRCGIYNKLTAFSQNANTYNLIPSVIQKFIIEKMKGDKKRASFLKVIRDKLLYLDEVSEYNISSYQSFIDSLSNCKQELLAYLTKEIPNLTFPNSQRVLMENKIMEIVAIEQKNLRFDDDALVNADFINRIIETLRPSVMAQQIDLSFDTNLTQFSLNFRQLYFQLNQINLLIDNELVRKILCPQYAQSQKAADKKVLLSNLVAQYNQIRQSMFNELKAMLKKDLIENGLFENEITDEQINEKLSEKFTNVNRYKKLMEIFTQIDKKLATNEITKNSAIYKALPKAPGETSVQYDPTAEQWGRNFLRIASELEVDGSLVGDTRELNRLAELLVNYTDADFQIDVLREIFDYPVKKRSKIIELLNGVFEPTSLVDDWCQLRDSYENNLYRTITATDTTAEKLFSNNFERYRSIAGHKIARTDTFSEQDYMEWKKCLIEIAGSEGDYEKNKAKLYCFITQTILHNLELPKIRKEDAEVIEWLCNLYLTKSKENQPLPYGKLPDIQKMPFEKRVNCLAGHLSILLTTLSNVSDLFCEGWICLMSRPDAQTKVLEEHKKSVAKPFIIRISNADPSNLVATHYTPGDKEPNMVGAMKKEEMHNEVLSGQSSKTFNIEGINIRFCPLDKIGLKKQIIDKGLTTPVVGDLSLEEVTSEKYAQENKKYYKTASDKNKKQTRTLVEKGVYQGATPSSFFKKETGTIQNDKAEKGDKEEQSSSMDCR